MKYLSPAVWNGLSFEQKMKHFIINDVEVDSQIVYGKQKFQAVCGGVIVSMWKDSEKDALVEAARSIAATMQDILIQMKNESETVMSKN